ncbi:Uncharacterised protein [Lysinibacillus capsici]|uniref:Uncharacterized protein n=1 Tax=Lysinibacillus capsici TaxID=2115968 RepID=A0A2X0XNP8_9BACI|nr:hypothetical protein [Lysinibacillus capsici]SPT99143.1 Uncharacterised protein [Lysinibacillus capsici]
MTKFIEQRVDELENQVAKLELIIHELRGKKTIEPSTTTTVEGYVPKLLNAQEDLNGVIEFEGQQYRKVDREAHEGDVVVFDKSVKFQGTEIVTKGKLYKAKKGTLGELAFVDNEGDSANVYDGGITKFTPENVAVYELIEGGLNPQIPIVDETIEPLTQNQQRAAIIEKAKVFVKNIVGEYDSFRMTIGQYKNQCVIPIFNVNEKKRAVTVLIYGAFSKRLIFKGLAKCNPNDVFNEHIGKAIALGRALGLDVSEFEQAVQPTVAVGQIVTHNASDVYTITEITTDRALTTPGTYYELSSFDKGGTYIINDTNAIYGGVE